MACSRLREYASPDLAACPWPRKCAHRTRHVAVPTFDDTAVSAVESESVGSVDATYVPELTKFTRGEVRMPSRRTR